MALTLSAAELENLFTELYQALLVLSDILQQEHAQLLLPKPTHLQTITQQKQTALLEVERYQARLFADSAGNQELFAQQLQNLLKQLPKTQALPLQTLWKKIIDCIQQGLQQNILNGNLAHYNLWKTRQLLDILAPEHNTPALYDEKGKVTV